MLASQLEVLEGGEAPCAPACPIKLAPRRARRRRAEYLFVIA